MYIPRILTKKLKEAIKVFPAVLITGPRQSGKTTLVLHELKDSHAYVTFDDPLNRSFALNDPKGFLAQYKDRPLILDEIQYVPEILSYIKIDIDKHHESGAWVLTGSQQFQFMRNISETLAGRVATLELPPFNFKEASYNRLNKLNDAVWNGGYPDPALHPEKRDLWLKGYLQTYIERDVRSLENIKNLRTFENFLNVCAAFHSNIFNSASIARDCGITLPTVKSWSGILEASFIILFLPPYFENFSKRLIKTPKIYFLDSAFVCLLTRQPAPESALAGAMGGAIFEGIIISEVYKAFYNQGKLPDAYFWRSHDGLEIDLLINAQGQIHPFEIKLTSTPTLDHLKPIQRFKKLAGNKAAERGILVCRVEEEQALPYNNLALPWYKFADYLEKLLS